jgi:hypothetical protein
MAQSSGRSFQCGWVQQVLAQSPALDQHLFTVQHEDGHRLVAEPFAMRIKLVDGNKRVAYPGGNRFGHSRCHIVAPPQDWPAAARDVTWSACP